MGRRNKIGHPAHNHNFPWWVPPKLFPEKQQQNSGTTQGCIALREQKTNQLLPIQSPKLFPEQTIPIPQVHLAGPNLEQSCRNHHAGQAERPQGGSFVFSFPASIVNMVLIRDEEKGRRGYGGGGRGRLYTYRYAVTTRMIPALRWAVMRTILMFQEEVMDKVTRQCPQTTTFLKRKESRSGIEPRSFRLPA